MQSTKLIMELTINQRIAKFGSEQPKEFVDLKLIKDLVKKGENLTTEFKLKATHPEKILKEIVAFANTDGGNLLIGVDDNLEIKGLKFAEEDEFLLIRAIEKHCWPPVNFKLKIAVLPNTREILLFEIPKSTEKPHFVNFEEGKIAYVRVNDKSVQASKEVRKYLAAQNSQKDIQFTYGDKESKLMQYLEENNQITVIDFSKIAKIPMWLASKTLVLLALANVLKIIPGELNDSFIRNLAK